MKKEQSASGIAAGTTIVQPVQSRDEEWDQWLKSTKERAADQFNGFSRVATGFTVAGLGAMGLGVIATAAWPAVAVLAVAGLASRFVAAGMKNSLENNENRAEATLKNEEPAAPKAAAPQKPKMGM